MLHPLKTRLKVTHLEMVHFIKVNELNLDDAELILLFYFKLAVYPFSARAEIKITIVKNP